jgi:hypothetical protein
VAIKLAINHNPALECFLLTEGNIFNIIFLAGKREYRGVAQLVEHWSPKPGVAGSSPVSPASFSQGSYP